MNALAFLLVAAHSFYSDIPASDTLEVPETIEQMLTAPFTYLGEGSQIAAYLSEDQAIALKLFKAEHHKSFKIKRIFKRKDQGRSQAKWKMKFAATTRRTQLAVTHLKEESALLYLHFQATPRPLYVTLKERDGTAHTIALNTLPFVMQKKATLAPEYLANLIAKGDFDGARAAVEALKSLFTARALKGFSDPRQSLSTNYGFVEGKPVQIDVGKIERDPDADPTSTHAKIDTWVKRHFPHSL